MDPPRRGQPRALEGLNDWLFRSVQAQQQYAAFPGLPAHSSAAALLGQGYLDLPELAAAQGLHRAGLHQSPCPASGFDASATELAQLADLFPSQQDLLLAHAQDPFLGNFQEEPLFGGSGDVLQNGEDKPRSKMQEKNRRVRRSVPLPAIAPKAVYLLHVEAAGVSAAGDPSETPLRLEAAPGLKSGPMDQQWRVLQAQRRFRERQKTKFTELTGKVEELEGRLGELLSEKARLEDRTSILEQTLELRRASSADLDDAAGLHSLHAVVRSHILFTTLVVHVQTPHNAP